MSHPGSVPGDPGDRQPGGWRYRVPSPYGYPAVGADGAAPTPYAAPPPGYSPPPPTPPWAYPPPPPYYPYVTAHAPRYHPSHPAPNGAQPATNGMAIGSLVSSLVAIPAYCLWLPLVGSIIGVVLGIVALDQIAKRHHRGKEMAIAGIVIGALTLLGALITVMV